MKKLVLLLLLATSVAKAQNFYFPPAGNTTWDTLSYTTLGWCDDKVDTLINYAGSKNTKGLLILVDGKIALEQYYGTFTKDSLWYWASAGKTLTAFLTGIAQQEGDLNINNKTSDYLGNGWTNAPQDKEDLITVRNQLTMTTGLDYNVPDDNCTADTCLNYLADAGTLWYYYNAPYRLINNVVEAATGINYNQYTNTKVRQPIGMSSGVWIQDIFYSRVRDAARFGLLMLNKGNWNGNQLLTDTAYYNQMVNTSQELNKSYGYLWWLNGKESCMVPTSSLVIPVELFPDAPDDVIAALGKNDQKIYVIPSLRMVVVRFGNAAGTALLGPSAFDNNLLKRIVDLPCTVGVTEATANKVNIYPNPSNGIYNLQRSTSKLTEIEVYNALGQVVYTSKVNTTNTTIDLSTQPNGIYLARVDGRNLRLVKE